MKTIFQFLVIILLFTFSEANGQKKDSLIIPPLMKSKSQIFIAEIKTNVGTQKGILYEADSNKIVILDSLFQRIDISVLDIKLLIVRRMNAARFGFKSGFYTFAIPSLILEVVWFAIGLAGSNAGFGAVLLVITPLAGLAFGLAFGGLMALASHYIPNKYINLERWEDEYLNQLKYIKAKTQKALIKKYPRKVRLV
jgi:hypothetical protein